MPNYSGLFRTDDSFALSLITAFLEVNGTEALEWEPETLRLEVKADFGITPSQTVMDKLQAAITILTTDHEYSWWEPFEEITHVLNDYEANFEVMRPPTVEEIAWGVLESNLIDPSEEPLRKAYSGEIQAYISLILQKAGFYQSPESLQFINMDKWCCDPTVEYPDLTDEIRDIQKVKMIRVRAYVADRYDKLSAEIRQYFTKSLPEVNHLLERLISWR
jgi:hypothetical protein